MRNRNSCVAAALQDWAGAIGPEFIISDSAELRAAETATFHTTQKIPVILRPGTRPEVCEIVRIANRHEVALYPVSSGKNWGYGSRVPVATDCALLDLSRINRITKFNEQLGYLTVEPGVT